MKSNSIQKNFAYQTIYRIITVLTPLITSPILSRALGAKKLGVFSATLAFVSYFQLFSMLGIENYGSRSIAATQGDKKKQSTLFWNIYAIQFIAGFLSIVAYFSICLGLPRERQLVSFLQSLWLIGALLNINWFFFGTEQFRLTVVRNIVIKVISLLLIVFFVKCPEDIYIYTIIMGGDTLLTNIVLWPFLKRNVTFERPCISMMREHIKPIVILFIPILAMSVFHIMDKSMLDWLSTETYVGYYYTADKIISIPLSIITGLSTVMLPRVSNEYNKGNTALVKKMLKSSTEVTLFLSCAIGFGIAAIAKEFVPWFFGNEFTPCIELVYIFIPVFIVKSIGSLVRSQYMIPSGMDWEFTISVCFGAITNLVFNYVLIQRYQAVGAVLGTLAAEIVVALFQLIYTRRKMNFVKYIFMQIPYFLFGIIMLFAVAFVKEAINGVVIIKLIGMVLTGATVYLLLCLLYWIVCPYSFFGENKYIKRIKSILF